MIRMLIVSVLGLAGANLAFPLLALGQAKESQSPDDAPFATDAADGRLKAAATGTSDATQPGSAQSEAARQLRSFLDTEPKS